MSIGKLREKVQLLKYTIVTNQFQEQEKIYHLDKIIHCNIKSIKSELTEEYDEILYKSLLVIEIYTHLLKYIDTDNDVICYCGKHYQIMQVEKYNTISLLHLKQINE